MEEMQPQDLEDLLQELEAGDGAGELLAPEVETKVRVCPECGKQNPENVWHCIDCGTTLSLRTLRNLEQGQPSGLSSIAPYSEQDVMDELRPEDVEGLVQEVEQEDSTQESPALDVEELLHALQSGRVAPDRRDAAEQLGNVGTSSARIVRALISATESDPHSEVRRAAARSLRAPLHQGYMQQKLGLAIEAKVAEVTSFLPVGNLRYWLLASLYAPGFLGATYLAFVAEGGWRFWVAGAVWFLGGCLGMYVLNKKGRGESLEDLLRKLEGPAGCGAYLLAAVGPFVLLAALLEPGQDR